jgi:hypothetical protein
MESVVTNRLIGIEIEVVLPIVGTGQNFDVQQLVADVLTAQGIRACPRAYSRQPIPEGCQVCVEHDSSIRDESRYAGIRWAKLEVKTKPMPWSDLERVLPPVLEILRYLGARVNESTGLHVHHHLPEVVERPEVVRNLQHLWWRFHPVMYGLVAPSRKSSQYCRPPQPIDAKRFDKVRSFEQLGSLLNRCDRYHGLNLTNLTSPERMTVEWRLHHGSVEWQKIKAWVLATQRWVEHAVARSCHLKPEPIPNTQAGLNALLVTTGLKPNSRVYSKVDKELRQVGKYLLRRWKRFNLPRDFKSKTVAA